jgi:hypothetical protein
VKVSKASCGADFSVVVSTKGEIYAWGAGGCGQLGTGRVSKRFKPEKISFNLSENDRCVDVSAGWGHVLASTANGELYSWGLNTYGQLGLGDTKTRFHPEKVVLDHAKEITGSLEWLVTKPVARRHHSACLLKGGELFSWGSGQGCLGQESENGKNISSPRQIQSIASQSLTYLALANKHMAAFACTSIRKIVPSYGPSKGGTTLKIEGSGFWLHPTAEIQLCFIAPDMPAQIVKGHLDKATGVITCSSPAWVEATDEDDEDEGVVYEEESDDGLGDEAVPRVVTVELSINGIDYTTNHRCFEYYEQAKLTAVEPTMLPATGGTKVTLIGEHLADFPDIQVRFTEVDTNQQNPRVVVVPGKRVLREAAPLDPSVEATEEVLYLRERNRVSDVICDSPVFPGASPVKVRVSIALNGFDFTEDDVFVTFFDPAIHVCQPNGAVATGNTVVQIVGNGFVPGCIPNIRFTVGNMIRDVPGECLNSQLIKCKAPPMILGITSEDLAKKRKDMEKFNPVESEKKWIQMAAAQASNHVEGTIQLTFNDRDFGEPTPFHFYIGGISSFTPVYGPIKGGTTLTCKG